MELKRKTKNYAFIGIFLIIVVFVTSVVGEKNVFAASASVGFEVSEPNIVVGDQFTISLTIDTDTYLGDFEGNISYDSSIIEYLAGPSCIAGGDGMLRIQDTVTEGSWETRSYVMTFEAVGMGDCELSLIGSPVAYDFDTQDPMSVSSSSKIVQITAPKTASDNANLSNLKISPSTLTPTFDPEVLEYSTIVDSTVTNLVISAETQDEKAVVGIEGNKDFIVGNNTVKIDVVAENGSKKEYTIQVVKEDVAATPTDTATEGEEFTVHANLEGGSTFISGNFAYTVASSEEGITIPAGYVKTSIKIDGFTVPVYQLEANMEDDYLLVVLQNQFGQTNLYRYDRFEKTIQRYTGDRVIIQEHTDNTELDLEKQKKEYENQLGQKNLIVFILAGVSILLLVGLISLFIKTKFHTDDDL
jgi:hypothetical protein